MSEIQADSHWLLNGMHFTILSSEKLKVECNWCDSDDYVFYRGYIGMEIHKDDWFAKAAIHMNKYHLDKLSPL